ncbi:helix-turn-helix domain-containing protein [Zavarzinia compransoris]|uniref:Uncharacterized protein n=1 Tax=Zavarzinia compransoris TaxID=1264899 RepID=A0A317E9Z1_9PROT|nr:helix-turn-helix domain-containing protein [Zavarzinia compransoris]PWR23372.1 hypothetical protein DKG75_02040 [Zavarzinia compransoris]TDP46055.1 hypothetical protein DES42_104136 [Zavarzinia compransoris]
MDWHNPPPSFLPGILEAIARAVSFEAALKVAAHWSGRRHVPAEPPDDHPLFALLGKRPARVVLSILRADSRAGRLSIPNAAHQRRQLAIANAYLQGLSIAAIARDTGIDRRTVERFVAAIRETVTPGQAELGAPSTCDNRRGCPWCGHRFARPRARVSLRRPGPLPLFGDEE